MCIATMTSRTGEVRRMLANGWTRSECDEFVAACARNGWSVEFSYGTWR